MTLIDQERVVEILVPDTSSLGTGYLLCNGCLLTAYHVIENHASKGIKFRLLGSYNRGQKEWAKAKCIWTNTDLDLVLLSVPLEASVNAPMPSVKKLNLNNRVSCRAYGFPKFRREEQEDNSTFNPYVVEGWIKP